MRFTPTSVRSLAVANSTAVPAASATCTRAGCRSTVLTTSHRARSLQTTSSSHKSSSGVFSGRFALKAPWAESLHTFAPARQQQQQPQPATPDGRGASHPPPETRGNNGGRKTVQPPATSAGRNHRAGPSKTRERSEDEQEAEGSASTRSRRAMLYVPGSSEKMIKKSQTSDADTIIFDLEDSVAAHRKGAAREAVLHGLNAAPRPGPELSVRINPPSGDQSIASDDLDIILPSRQLQAIVLPKVESAVDVRMVIEKAEALRGPDDSYPPISLVLSVESSASLLNMPQIIEQVRSWKKDHVAYVSALLFASEDYCAATSIIRTRSRRELLFPRAHMATIAKANGLAAIDMVCIDYKDEAYLAEECQDGRELGFDGKQAIHPTQVDEIQKQFSPSDQAILRAARIKYAYEKSVREHKGAVGMKEGDSMVMIDAPLLKQAEATLAKARAGKLHIPEVQDE